MTATARGRRKTALAAATTACAAAVVGVIGLTNLDAMGDALRRFAGRATDAVALAEPSAINEAVTTALADLSHEFVPQRGAVHRLALALQDVLLRLRRGNAQVLIADDNTMHLREGIRYSVGPGFLEPGRLARRRTELAAVDGDGHADPRPAILSLHYALRAQRKHLVVLVVPPKAAIAWTAGTTQPAPQPPDNPSYGAFLDTLRRRGIPVIDAGVPLRAVQARGDQAYLATDTHWSPAGVDAVAADLADRIRTLDGRAGNPAACADVASRVETRTSIGLLARMLGYGDDDTAAPHERVQVRVVERPAVKPPAPRVTIVGDSFTNIYSQPDLGWGVGAGLAEQLGRHLCEYVDAVAINDGGAFQSRMAFAMKIGAEPERLASLQIVVLEFSAIDLATGNWWPLPLRISQ